MGIINIYIFSFFFSSDNIAARRENRNSAMQVIQVRQRKQQQLATAVIQEPYVIHNRVPLSLFLSSSQLSKQQVERLIVRHAVDCTTGLFQRHHESDRNHHLFQMVHHSCAKFKCEQPVDKKATFKKHFLFKFLLFVRYHSHNRTLSSTTNGKPLACDRAAFPRRHSFPPVAFLV